MDTPTPLVAGNWKMNGTSDQITEFKKLVQLLSGNSSAQCQVAICPPFTLIAALAAEGAESVHVGAQDCHAELSGAHTGDISAAMVADAGAKFIIVGHSERRADHEEGSELIRAKAQAVYKAGVTAIVCVGETESERDAGKTEDVVLGQLLISLPDDATSTNTVVGYEPVWAIGTGKTPTVADVAEIHTAIRGALVERFGDDGHMLRIIYGGSVKPSNAKELMTAENVDGALVGGASLKAQDFNGIIEAYRA
ncbi:MAG: triose-phosphate isomerase [Kordiimonadales bacterium]|nr:MAG: triose-phosphate isomerase [Kordiimonadales bacterium]